MKNQLRICGSRLTGRFDFYKKICYNKKKWLLNRPGPHLKNTLHSVFASLLETYECSYAVVSYVLNYIPLLDNFLCDMKHMKKSWQIYKLAVSRLTDRPSGHFREKTGPYERLLEVREFLHMGEPIGNTACAYRLRPAMWKNRICTCTGEPVGSAEFRENY